MYMQKLKELQQRKTITRDCYNLVPTFLGKDKNERGGGQAQSHRGVEGAATEAVFTLPVHVRQVIPLSVREHAGEEAVH